MASVCDLKFSSRGHLTRVKIWTDCPISSLSPFNTILPVHNILTIPCITMAINPQITNLVIILGMMQVSKKIPFDDPQVLMGIRIVYVASNFLILALYYYVQTQINKKKGAYCSLRDHSEDSADQVFVQTSPPSNTWSRRHSVPARSLSLSRRLSMNTTTASYGRCTSHNSWVWV